MNPDQEELDEGEYVEEALFQRSSDRHPLLRRKDSNAELPWTRRPHLFWLLPPFFLVAVMSGAAITPRLSLISNLLCKSYYASKGADVLSPAQTGEQFDCNIAAISGQIARLSTALNTTTGILSAVTAAKLGLWSDRRGRRYPLMITMCGSLLNDLCYVLVAKYYNHLGIYFLFVGAMCDGMTGSFMSAMAATYAYTTDVVSPQRRAVAFGYFQCSFYGGIALGPTLGGYLVKKTGSVLIIFYLAMALHAAFALWTLLVLPESLSKTRIEVARVKYETERNAAATHATTSAIVTTPSKILSFFNIFNTFGIFFPKDAHVIVRRNLQLLMGIDVCLLLNMGAFTVIILYGKYMFRWSDLEQGYLLSLIGGIRCLVLLLVLPIIVRFVRGKFVHVPHNNDVEREPEGADRLDVYLIRASMVLEVLGFLFFSMAQTSASYLTAGAISAFAGIGMPTLASVLTKHVPSTQTGQLLGAVALIQSLNRVFAPLLFGLLYSATVATHPATSFLVLAGMMGLGFLLSLGLRPSTPSSLGTIDEI